MNVIAALAGMILSFAFRFIPGLKTWFEGLSSEGKSGVMAIVIVAAGVGTALWQCSSPEGGATMADCLSLGWRQYAAAIFSALVTNQATHQITPEAKKG
jgi:hypothetical protein